MINNNALRLYLVFNFFLKKHYPNFDGDIPKDALISVFQTVSGTTTNNAEKFILGNSQVGIIYKSLSKSYKINEDKLNFFLKELTPGEKKFADDMLLDLVKKMKGFF